jgi:predicted outer membrane protein
MIAQCLAIDNEEEIAIARLAAAKVNDRGVRDFAERLIQDHSNFLAELKRFGAQPVGLDGADNRATDDRAAADTAPRQRQPQTEGNAVAAGAHQGLDMLAVKRQVAQMCLANARRAFSEDAQGEVAMSYIGHQIPAHEKMVVVQKVLRQYASPELQGVLDKGIETAQAHLDQAKQLIHSQPRQERANQQARDKDSQ